MVNKIMSFGPILDESNLKLNLHALEVYKDLSMKS